MMPLSSSASIDSEILARRIRSLLKPKNHILQLYCTRCHLIKRLNDYAFYGIDKDEKVITSFQKQYPQHAWKSCSDREIPFTQLPENIHCLLAFFPEIEFPAPKTFHPLEVIRYLLGRYLPRTACFGTNIDSQSQSLLRNIKQALVKLGYNCHEELIEPHNYQLIIAKRDQEWPNYWIFNNFEEAFDFFVSELPKSFGTWKLASTFAYHQKNGQESFRVLRFENGNGHKLFYRLTPYKDKWRLGTATEKLELYRLPSIMDETEVIVVEGEKAAEAAIQLGLSVTTSHYGSNTPTRTDWSPLAGRDVVIFPDNDSPGRHYATTVKALLKQLKPASRVKFVSLPGLNPSGDIADFIAERKKQGLSSQQISKEIRNLIEEAPYS